MSPGYVTPKSIRTMFRRSRPYNSSRCAAVMTSYGGASTPPSFTCSGLKRVPANGLTSAISRHPSRTERQASEPNLAELVEHRRLAHFLEQRRANRVVDLHQHHGMAARPVSPQLDAGDVDVVAREQRGDGGDDTGAIL